MTRLRRLAMMRGPLAVRTWERSSSKSRRTDPVQPVFDAPVAADDGRELGVAGLSDGQRGDRIAGFARPLPFHRAAACDLDGLGSVGEGQASGYRGDFEGAPFGAAVAAFPLVIRFRHVAPGQGGKLGVQAGLVALDDQQVVRAAPGQEGGVLALGVQSIGGDDRIGDVQAAQQRGEHGDLVGLGTHLHLAQHRAMSMVIGGEQVTAVLLPVAGAA